MSGARCGLMPRLGGLALGLTLALATSGCVAAGLATGPLMSAVQLIGDRTVERTVAADLAEAQGATEAVLVKTAFRIEHREREDGLRRLRAVADDVTVHATLERVTAKLTRVGLRVERGRVLADRDTSTQMHDQIAALLAPPPTPAGDPGTAEAMTTLQGEIQRLRSDLEHRRAERPVPPRESRPTVRVEAGAVVNVPISAALPTVGGPAPPISVAVPATAPAVPATAPAVPAVRSISSPPDAGQPAPGALMTAPLTPAGALTPIQGVVGVGTGQ